MIIIFNIEYKIGQTQNIATTVLLWIRLTFMHWELLIVTTFIGDTICLDLIFEILF